MTANMITIPGKVCSMKAVLTGTEFCWSHMTAPLTLVPVPHRYSVGEGIQVSLHTTTFSAASQKLLVPSDYPTTDCLP